jgi:hypothetical protein
MAPSKLTLQEFTTTLAADEVLERAKGFFSRRSALYAAFLDKEGPGYCTFRGQGGEEICIAAQPALRSDSDERAGAGGTRVTGSTYLFDMQVARFLATLPAAT